MEVDEARDIGIGISERGEQTIIHDECCMKHKLSCSNGKIIEGSVSC